MLLVDTFEKSITRDEELKQIISENRPHGEWWKQHVTLEKLRKKNSVRFEINIYISFENCNVFFYYYFLQMFLLHISGLILKGNLSSENKQKPLKKMILYWKNCGVVTGG